MMALAVEQLGDLQANGSEIKTVRTATEGSVEFSFTADVNGLLGLVFSTRSGSIYELHYWIDDGFGAGTAGDSLINGSELRLSAHQNARYPLAVTL